MKHLSKKSVILIILIQIFYCADKSWADPNLVFVSIAPQKFFVERIGGNEIQVEVWSILVRVLLRLIQIQKK